MSHFQHFVQRIGVRAEQVNVYEFDSIFREESQRVAGIRMEDPRFCDNEALENLIRCWHEALPANLSVRDVVLNHGRPRAWVELLRRELRYDQVKLLAACRRLVKLSDDPHPGLVTWNEACNKAVDDVRKAVL